MRCGYSAVSKCGLLWYSSWIYNTVIKAYTGCFRSSLQIRGYIWQCVSFPHCATAPSGPRTPQYREAPHSIGLLWTSDQPDTETSFIFNKTNRRTNFPNLFLSRNSTCFGQFLCPKHVEFIDKNKFGKSVRLLVLLKINLLRCTVTWT